jgi:hypothetical protein
MTIQNPQQYPTVPTLQQEAHRTVHRTIGQTTRLMTRPRPPWSDCDASGSGSPATKTGKPNYLSNNVWFCYGEVEAFGDYAAVFPDTAHSDWGQLAREGYPVEINYKSTSVECVLYCHLQVLKPKSQRKSVVWDDGFKVVESKKITPVKGGVRCSDEKWKSIKAICRPQLLDLVASKDPGSPVSSALSQMFI